MRINQDNFAIYIVTYNRQKALNKSIRLYLESLPFVPPITVISNHSKCLIDDDLKEYVNVIDNVLRPDESWGYLPRNWNQCFQLGLVDHEWLLCSQDDVIVKPGWLEQVNSTDYDFYSAPLGETRFLLNRAAFRRVGWFDERFCGLGFQEHDYFIRILNLMPESASIVDQHRQEFSHNSVGLENYWFQPENDGFSKNEQIGGRTHAKFWSIYRQDYFQKKWGTNPFKKVMGIHPDRLPREFDWYPFISGKYEYLRITNPQYRFCGREQEIARQERERTLHTPRTRLISMPRCEVLAYCHLPKGIQFELLDKFNRHITAINNSLPYSVGAVILSEHDDGMSARFANNDYISVYDQEFDFWNDQFATLTDFTVIFESEQECVTANGYQSNRLLIHIEKFLTLSLDDIWNILEEMNVKDRKKELAQV